VQFQLLFRGSEHDFKAAAFHKHCDNIEDTLTLVCTEFEKTMAGYSHYKWNADDKYDFVHDEGRRAFLLSFDKAEKYVPQGGEKLIYCQLDMVGRTGKVLARASSVLVRICARKVLSAYLLSGQKW
jgi:hypothetical protein